MASFKQAGLQEGVSAAMLSFNAVAKTKADTGVGTKLGGSRSCSRRAADGMSAGCQSSICRPQDRHCCLTCSLRKSLPGGCRGSQAPLQSALLPAEPELALDFCCQVQSPLPYAPRHYQYPEPYLPRQEAQSASIRQL